ncbi:MAG: RHS repeat-associated core domain-containing protein [Kiritimatiellia bacterium]
MTAQYVYDPYGSVIDTYGTSPNLFSFGFSTKYHDRETGMVAYQRRFYRSDLGRWLNRDPIEEVGGENLYAFCGNAPVLYVDVLGLSFWDDLIDSAKIAVGICTIVSGALAGAATSWTGAGAVMGGTLFILGVDQVFEGINNIASRVKGGPASDNSFVKQIISSTSHCITGTRNSQLEIYLQSTYSAIQLTSSCYSGIVKARSVVKAINLTYVPPHSEIVPVLRRSTIQWQIELKASYWRINGVKDAASGAFSLLFQGISSLKHEVEGEGHTE